MMKKGIALIGILLFLLSICFAASAQKTDIEQYSKRSSGAEQMPKAEIPQMQSGDIVVFGHYEQDGNRNNGKEPIEWLILSVEDGQALMISLKLLEVKQYHSEQMEMTWEGSSLREWLNEGFYKSAFTEEEQAQILLTAIHTPDNPKFGTSGGKDTQDRIFLLSIDEAESLFLTGKSRAGEMTVWAKNNANKVGASDSWWLRSSGQDARYAAYVYKSGEAAPAGNKVSVFSRVRPSIRLNISDLKKLSGLVGTPAPTPTPTPVPPPTVISVEEARKLGLEIPEPSGSQVLYLGEAETEDAERVLAVFLKRPERSTLEDLKIFVYKASFDAGIVRVSGLTATMSANGPVSISNGNVSSGNFNFRNFEFTDDGAEGYLTYTLYMPLNMGGASYTFKDLEMNFVKIMEP